MVSTKVRPTACRDLPGDGEFCVVRSWVVDGQEKRVILRVSWPKRQLLTYSTESAAARVASNKRRLEREPGVTYSVTPTDDALKSERQ